MANPKQKAPESSDGSEAVLALARKSTTHQERILSVRTALANKPMACHDCRSLRDGFVMLIDSLVAGPGDVVTEPEETEPAEPATTHHAHSTVTMVAPVPTPGAAQGGQVAPGVVIIPADKASTSQR